MARRGSAPQGARRGDAVTPERGEPGLKGCRRAQSFRRLGRPKCITSTATLWHIFPPLQVWQWVLSVPKRLRYFLEREPAAASAVLHMFLRVVETHLHERSPGVLALGLSHRRIPRLFLGTHGRISRIACPGGIAVEDGTIREALGAAAGMRIGQGASGRCWAGVTVAGAGPPSWSQNGRVSSGTNRSGWRSESQWNLRSTWDSRAGR